MTPSLQSGRRGRFRHSVARLALKPQERGGARILVSEAAAADAIIRSASTGYSSTSNENCETDR